MVENDAYPSPAQLFDKISELMLSLSAEFVRTCWKMCGLATMTHTPEESEQFAIAVSNADVEEDDHKTCEPEPEQEDDGNEMVELVPVEPEVLVAPPSPILARITSNKTQSSITDFFLPKKQ